MLVEQNKGPIPAKDGDPGYASLRPGYGHHGRYRHDSQHAPGLRKSRRHGRRHGGGRPRGGGVHLQNLIAKWDLTDQLKAKIVPPVPNVPIGEIVARGDADIGFQQVSELLPVKGIDYLGPLPSDIQETTVFSAAVHTAATEV